MIKNSWNPMYQESVNKLTNFDEQAKFLCLMQMQENIQE